MGTMNSEASKSNDIRFQWLKCRKAQLIFKFLWAQGHYDQADDPSKHHQASHHQRVRPSVVIDWVLSQWCQSLNSNVVVHTSGDILLQRMCDLFCFNIKNNFRRLFENMWSTIHLQECANLILSESRGTYWVPRYWVKDGPWIQFHSTTPSSKI